MITEPSRFLTTPSVFLTSALKAVPAVRWAVGLGGVTAVVALIAGFQIDLRIAVFGTALVLGGMFVLLVFARLAAMAGALLVVPALVATWALLLIFIAALLLLLTSYFFRWPRSIESAVGAPEVSGPGRIQPDKPIVPDRPPESPTFDAACYADALKKLVGPSDFKTSGRVDCDGGGIRGDGEHEAKTVTLNAIPGFELLGAATPHPTSDNGGSVGAVNYTHDAQGRIVSASVGISCRSPNRIAGPGAWMAIDLGGVQQRIVPVTPQEIVRLQAQCPPHASAEALRPAAP